MMAEKIPQVLVYDITQLLGDSLSEKLTWKDSTGAYIDFTGSTAIGQIKLNKTDALDVETFAITLGNAASNLMFNLTANEVSSMGVGKWFYDIQVTTGTTVRTYVTGKLKIVQDVSR